MIMEFQAAAATTRNGWIVSGLLAVTGLGTLAFGRGSVDDPLATGSLALALAVAMMGYTRWMARQRTPPLRIDDGGIWFKDWRARVPWGQVADAYQSGARLRPFVTLRLRDPEAFLADLGPREAKALRRNRLWKPPELNIPSAVVEGSQREILDAVRTALDGSAGDPASRSNRPFDRDPA